MYQDVEATRLRNAGVGLKFTGGRWEAEVWYNAEDGSGYHDDLIIGRFPVSELTLETTLEMAAAIRDAHLIGVKDGRLHERSEARNKLSVFFQYDPL